MIEGIQTNGSELLPELFWRSEHALVCFFKSDFENNLVLFALLLFLFGRILIILIGMFGGCVSLVIVEQ